MAAPSKSDAHYHSVMYYDHISTIPDPISDLFEQYSGINKSEQLQHVKAVRDQAYTTHAYPCLGRFRFLELELSQHPLYQSHVVPALKRSVPDGEVNPNFLDLGTCLGQDVRKLAFDGVPASRLYGSDIEQSFIDTGYEMFLDQDKLPRDHFLCPGDVFQNPRENALSILQDRVDILNASAVFHLFDKAKQIDVARCCMRLLRKTQGSRSLVLGGHVGNTQAIETERHSGKKFRHNETTWKQLWEDVCKEPEFRDKVQKLEVESSLQSANWTPSVSQIPNEGSAPARKDGADIEEGFRWMRWQVWITF